HRVALPVAAQPDSQDICFAPTGSYARLVEKLRPGALTPGDIVDTAGRILGRHDGIINFTVGQRRGLGIAGGEKLFVLRLEPETHRVVVRPRAALAAQCVGLAGVNWLGGGAEAASRRVAVKLRSPQPLAAATLTLGASRTGEVVLDEPIAGIAPGQACVIYD